MMKDSKLVIINNDTDHIRFAWDRSESQEKPAYILKQGQSGLMDKKSPAIQRSKFWESVLIKKSGKSKVVQYDPFNDHLDCYRQFVSLGFEESTILDFVNQYGLLGLQEGAYIEGLKGLRYVERISSWRQQISQFAILLDLWDCLRSGGDRAGLESRIIWHRDQKRSKSKLESKPKSNHPVKLNKKAGKTNNDIFAITHHYKSPMGLPIEGGDSFLFSEDYPQLFEKIEYGDLVEPAWIQVRSTINAQLRKHTSMQLMGKVTDEGSSELNAKPNNLLGALWLQLAYEVAGIRVYSRCDNCNKIIVEPIKRGQIRKTCSDACRQALSRKTRHG